MTLKNSRVFPTLREPLLLHRRRPCVFASKREEPPENRRCHSRCHSFLRSWRPTDGLVRDGTARRRQRRRKVAKASRLTYEDAARLHAWPARGRPESLHVYSVSSLLFLCRIGWNVLFFLFRAEVCSLRRAHERFPRHCVSGCGASWRTVLPTHGKG